VNNRQKKNDSYSNASLRQSQDNLAKHDKAIEARAIAINKVKNEKAGMSF
jgi:hypothetical protein